MYYPILEWNIKGPVYTVLMEKEQNLHCHHSVASCICHRIFSSLTQP